MVEVRERRILVLVCVVMAAILAGCSSSLPEVQLGTGKPSPVKTLPVPKPAVLTVRQADEVSYVLPTGVSLSSLDHWYAIALPSGRPWRDWAVCTPKQMIRPARGTSRNWRKGTAVLDLSTSIANKATGQVGITILEWQLATPSVRSKIVVSC